MFWESTNSLTSPSSTSPFISTFPKSGPVNPHSKLLILKNAFPSSCLYRFLAGFHLESFPIMLGLSSINYRMDMTKLPSLIKLLRDFTGHTGPSKHQTTVNYYYRFWHLEMLQNSLLWIPWMHTIFQSYCYKCYNSCYKMLFAVWLSTPALPQTWNQLPPVPPPPVQISPPQRSLPWDRHPPPSHSLLTLF